MIFSVWNYDCYALSNSLSGDQTAQIVSGEMRWFYTVIRYLQESHTVIHCTSKEQFMSVNADYYLMDYFTISQVIQYLNPEKVFCLCYWGCFDKYISPKNVLTPFDYGIKNRFLGYCTKYLCTPISEIKYKNIGVIWGKHPKYINHSLVKYLVSEGIEFYSTCVEPIPGVHNLGCLPINEWHQLLNDAKFVLGFGDPKSGPTILEALFYKTAIVAPKTQIPDSVQCKNTLFTDNLTYKKIALMIKGIEFVEEPLDDTFNQRITAIFKL
uniref:Glycosyltransferase family 18 catalytic domain-containing protein n=1 Tax=viral metagenome TaxID=1070528 RepID=A0A6C0CTB1_9ZZZZ